MVESIHVHALKMGIVLVPRGSEKKFALWYFSTFDILQFVVNVCVFN